MMDKDKVSGPLFSDFESTSFESWKEKVTADLKGVPYEKLVWKTPEGFEVQPYYTPEQINELEYLKSFQNQNLNTDNPAEGSRYWINNEPLTVKKGQEANSEKLALSALNAGADGILFDLNENPSADLSKLLDQVQINYCGLSFLVPAEGDRFLSEYFDYISSKNINKEDLHGFIAYDPLSEWTIRGKKEDRLFEKVKNALETGQSAPNFYPLTLNATYFHNSGAHAVQELAYTLNLAVAYLDALTEKGMDAGSVLRNMAVRMPVSTSYFMQIAKFRALRVLFTQLAQAYGVNDYSPKELFIHAESSFWSKTAYDANVNMLRNTTEAMSAILGGSNSLSISAHDAVFEQTTGRGRRIARNISAILKEESYLDKVVDPSAGSYYIETLTDSLVQHAWKLFQDTEANGGFEKAFEKGEIQKAIEASRNKQHEQIASARMTFIGTNKFPDQQESIDPQYVHRYEEITSELPLLRPQRATEAFDQVRFRTENAVKAGQDRPGLFLPMMGNPAMRTARANFAANFFGCAGFIAEQPVICNEIEEAVNKAAQSDAQITVLCGSDDFYEEKGEAFAKAFKAKVPGKFLILAGDPGEKADSLKQAGFDGFIHIKSDMVRELTAFQDKVLK